MKARVIAPIVIVVVVIAAIGYYEYSAYGQAVVQTTIVSGKITAIETASSAGNAGGLPGQGGGGLGLGGGGGGAKGAISSGSELITISVGGKVSFSQLLPCTASGFQAPQYGQTVQVADQLLRNGQHQYVANIACPGALTPFQSMHITQTSTSTTHQ